MQRSVPDGLLKLFQPPGALQQTTAYIPFAKIYHPPALSSSNYHAAHAMQQKAYGTCQWGSEAQYWPCQYLCMSAATETQVHMLNFVLLTSTGACAKKRSNPLETADGVQHWVALSVVLNDPHQTIVTQLRRHNSNSCSILEHRIQSITHLSCFSNCTS